MAISHWIHARTPSVGREGEEKEEEEGERVEGEDGELRRSLQRALVF